MEVDLIQLREQVATLGEKKLDVEVLFNSSTKRLMIKLRSGKAIRYGWGAVYKGKWWLSDGGVFLREMLAAYPCDCLKTLKENIMPCNFHIGQEIALFVQIIDEADPFFSLLGFIYKLGEFHEALENHYQL